MNKPYDVVLYGATGFTGRQTVAYFHNTAPDGLRWAIAGRNPAKLDEVADTCAPGRSLDRLIASGDDRKALDTLCAQTRVVLTTAGPFTLYGRLLVDACVAHGVHYVDITGETPFVAQLIESHHDQAMQDGTRIIPFSGFDSVPSDVVAYLAAQHFQAQGTSLRSVLNGFTLRGGLNGGTMATAFMLSGSNQGKALRDVLLLNPAGHRTKEEARESRDLRAPLHDDHLGWLAPFFMGPVNTRVVRRTNGLLAEVGQPYGETFRYQEAWSCRSSFQARARTLSLGLVDGLMRTGWGRTCLRPWLPKPGQGPSESTMDGGFFRCRALAISDEGEKIEVLVSASGDPGNRVTVTALCESALSLAEDDLSQTAFRGGVLTPMTGLGDALITRLRQVGWEMSVRPLES